MKKQITTVILDPELESHAGDLDAQECRQLAEIYREWIKQLELKAAVLDACSEASYPRHPAPHSYPGPSALN